MTRSVTLMRASAAVAAALLGLAACTGGEDGLATLDNRLAANDADPALTAVLQDQIMVDPELSGQSNANAVRPPETPTQASYPPPDDSADAGRTIADAGGQTAAQGGSPCGGAFDSDPRWAQRLPAPFGVYPGSSVTQAAGSDSGGCRAGMVAFTAPAPARELIAWYRGRAEAAGYSADYQNRQGHHVLAGTSGADAYYLIVTPRAGTSEVALIASNRR